MLRRLHNDTKTSDQFFYVIPKETRDRKPYEEGTLERQDETPSDSMYIFGTHSQETGYRPGHSLFRKLLRSESVTHVSIFSESIEDVSVGSLVLRL